MSIRMTQDTAAALLIALRYVLIGVALYVIVMILGFTPIVVLAGLLGMTLVFSRTFEAITNTFALAIWPFYALSVAAIFRLRRSRPNT